MMFDVNTGPIECKWNYYNCMLDQRLLRDKTCLIYTFFGLINVPVIPLFT